MLSYTSTGSLDSYEENTINFVKIDNDIYAVYYYQHTAYFAVKTDLKNKQDIDNITTNDSRGSKDRKNMLCCNIPIPIDGKNIENFTPTKNDICIGDFNSSDNLINHTKDKDCLIKTNVDNKNLKNILLFSHGNVKYSRNNNMMTCRLKKIVPNEHIRKYFTEKYEQQNVELGWYKSRNGEKSVLNAYLKIKHKDGVEECFDFIDSVEKDSNFLIEQIPNCPHFKFNRNQDNEQLLQVIFKGTSLPISDEDLKQFESAIKNNKSQKYLIINDYSCYGAGIIGGISFQSAMSAIDCDNTIIINTIKKFNKDMLENDKSSLIANRFIKGKQKFFNCITPYLSHIIFDKRLALNEEQLKTFDCYCTITHEDYIELQNAMSKNNEKKIDDIIQKYQKIKQNGRKFLNTSLLCEEIIKLLEQPLYVNLLEDYFKKNNQEEITDNTINSKEEFIKICKKLKEKLPYVQREALDDKNGECITDLGKTKYNKKTGKFSFQRNETKKDIIYKNLNRMTELQKQYLKTKSKNKRK